MPTLITADLHLTEQPKDRYRFAAMDFIAEMITERDVDQLIILGDLTHNKNHHPDTLVNDVVDVLYNFSCLCPVYILQGNHDYVEADTPFFHFVRLLKDVHWINRPTMKDIGGLGRCCFLPHTRDYEHAWAGIKVIWHETNGVIFAHNAFEGAVSETGKQLPGIPLSIFPRGQKIISGDIHKPQDIGDYLTYVGAPTTQKYGDDYEPRVLLLGNGGMESVEVPGPQKRLFDISNADEMNQTFFQFERDDMIKVRYHLHAGDRDAWPEIKKEIKSFFGDNAQIQAVLERQELARIPIKKSLADDKQLLKDYGTQQNLSAAMLETGYELFNEA